MSDVDRQKWNARYASGSTEPRPPSAFLCDWIEPPRSGRALDVACGAGRNAVYLAECGYSVDAVDISSVAIARGRALADSKGVTVNWQCEDLLEEGPEPELAGAKYDLIVVFRFVAPDLVASLMDRLNPEGLLLIEEHLQTSRADVTGPASSRFRVAPGDLKRLIEKLVLLHDFEGEVMEPDGSTAMLARVVARQSSN
jgi:SAM-dependent methyltransferase